MANNYTPSYNQYLTQTAGYALPSSVRSYSVFDPSSNSWRRMTNDGRSPMPMTPAQEQAAVAGALMQAQQTQGKVWNPLPAPVQGMTQTQTPGILLRPKAPVQAPSQVPSGNPRATSPVSQPRRGRGFLQAGPEEGTISLGVPAAAVVQPVQQKVPAYNFTPLGTKISTVLAAPNLPVKKASPASAENPAIRQARLLGTLPNPDPTPVPSIVPSWSDIGEAFSRGLARFAHDGFLDW